MVGLETLRMPAEWRTIVGRIGSDRAVFSLDLRDGQPIVARPWKATDPLVIVDRVVAIGCRSD